eukprot:1872736-Rhodomonas_salina.3
MHPADLVSCSLDSGSLASDWQVSTRAWTFLPLHNLYMGERELVMYEKPVVLGPRATRASTLKGFSLTLRVLACPSGV